ncbi:hypothetical protein [Cryptosporangium aurantiacum]|uniref:Uncharacterized protein n=1 Tax=Cryptosporangium aurantiacum TaxID=134849 RepID=A0A1M7RKY7_9ACTN|nr:hypothetical protein [Cryptosporangium aurantiacum]SHN46811.1 hypothetical protein SAMN05443668_11841 [Cryptosporangium aurantiacum]
MSETDEEVHAKSASRSLFDLRWLIAGLFVLYGALLIVLGIFDTDAEVQKADGIRINLWTGIGMLILGALFGLWSWWRPLRPNAPASVAAQSEEHDSDA